MKNHSHQQSSNRDILLVASACKVKSAHFIDGLSGIASVFHVMDFDLLKDKLVQLKPEMLLLDYGLPLLNGVRGISELRTLCPDTNVVIFHNSASDEDEWAMLKAGVRGCCSTDMEPSALKQMVFAVNNGELWIRRKCLHRLMDDFVEMHRKKQTNTIEARANFHHLVDQLTRRELEIAFRVANGESNKQIAYSLQITERTVKAHLTKVFDKLGVSDRLNMALIVSAEQRQMMSEAKFTEHPILVS